MTRKLLTAAFLAGTLALPGCVVLQGSYDSEARRSCDDIPNVEDRLTCERALRDAQQQRRADDLREN